MQHPTIFPGICQSLWIRWKQAQHKKSCKQLGFLLVEPYFLSGSPPTSVETHELFPDHGEDEAIFCITPISGSLESSLPSSSSEESLTQSTINSTDEQVELHQVSIEPKPLRPLPVAPRVPTQPVRKVRALPTPPSTPPPTRSLPPRLEIATKMLRALALHAADSPIVHATGLPTPNRESWLVPSGGPVSEEFSTTAPIDWRLLEEALGCC